MLSRELHQKIIDTLKRVPLTGQLEGRNVMLMGIPTGVVSNLQRNANQGIDLHEIINQLDQLGYLEDDITKPLIIFLENAQQTVAQTTIGKDLATCIREIKLGDRKETPFTRENPEAIIFGGSPEWLSYNFFARGIDVPRSVARLKIQRFFGSRSNLQPCFGTGWLITPDLLMTNYHVIEARDHLRHEAPATPEDLARQLQHMQIWFDYFDSDNGYDSCQGQELACIDEELDFAIVRIDCNSLHIARKPLEVAHQQTFFREDRLNIAQYPFGNPLQIAIRNNFFIDHDQSNNDFIRYITNTEGGSSGAPVCNDHWQVVAMHCKSSETDPFSYKGETIQHHNVGIEISSILSRLPPQIHKEIAEAQGWI